MGEGPGVGEVSKLLLILRATVPVGRGDGVLSKLLLVMRVDVTHQKYRASTVYIALPLR